MLKHAGPGSAKKDAEYLRKEMADRAGFEPAIRFPVYTLSRRAPSTTRPPVRLQQPAFAFFLLIALILWVIAYKRPPAAGRFTA
jgi:hypothetical protein